LEEANLSEIIGEEVEAVCADFARRAAAAGERTFRLSDTGHFDPEVSRELLAGFELDAYAVRPILDRLHAELVEFAGIAPQVRSWGRITTDGSSLILEVDVERASAVPDLDELGADYWSTTPTKVRTHPIRAFLSRLLTWTRRRSGER
jgi:hypothetical protein